jgi:5-methyltetrahydrofolate--homocysteine methyltransferase
VRREWYAPDERLSDEDLLKENFRGIRPAFGYPACPDHSEKPKLVELLGAERAGIALTETFSMTPAAAVSGLYFHHPQSKYFAVGRIGHDQVEDYARRRGIPVAEAEKSLSHSLG